MSNMDLNVQPLEMANGLKFEKERHLIVSRFSGDTAHLWPYLYFRMKLPVSSGFPFHSPIIVTDKCMLYKLAAGQPASQA